MNDFFNYSNSTLFGGINNFGLILYSLYQISGQKVIILIDEYNSWIIKKFLLKKQ